MFVRDDLVGHSDLGAPEYHAIRLEEETAGAPDIVVAAWPYGADMLSEDVRLAEACELIFGASGTCSRNENLPHSIYVR